jgi:hypothetical protein
MRVYLGGAATDQKTLKSGDRLVNIRSVYACKERVTFVGAIMGLGTGSWDVDRTL